MPPKPVSSSLAAKILSFLIKIKPNISLKAGLRGISVSKNVKEPDQTPDYQLLSRIDTSIEVIIHYLSAANWEETYSVVYSKLQLTLHSNPNANTDSDLIPGIELYGVLYLDAPRLEVVLSDFSRFAPKMKLQMHRLLIEHFLQRSILYWILSHHVEYTSIEKYPTLVQVASNLFDSVYDYSDDEKRRNSVWRFLGTIICLIPKSFEAYNKKCLISSRASTSSLGSDSSSIITNSPNVQLISQSKPTKSLLKAKQSTSNKLRSFYSGSSSGSNSSNIPSNTLDKSSIKSVEKDLQRKLSFLVSLSKLQNINQSSSLFLPLLLSMTELNKAAAILASHEVDSPIITFSKSLYHTMFSHLYPPKVYPDNVAAANMPLLYDYQCAFITSFTVISTSDIMRDVYPLLEQPEVTLIGHIPSILQGYIDLRLMPGFTSTFHSVATVVFPLIRDALIRAVGHLHRFEEHPNFAAHEGRGIINVHYHTCTNIILKCYFLFTLSPDYFLVNYTYQRPFEKDKVFYSMSRCFTSSNDDIRRTTFAFTWSFLTEETLFLYDPAETAADLQHSMYSLYMHFGKLSQLVIQKVIQHDFTDAVVIEHLDLIKAMMRGRCLLSEQYQFYKVSDNDVTNIESSEIRFEISSAIEMSLLILILSKNVKICKLALEILNFMVQEAIICENLEYPETSSWSLVNNFALYSELSSSSYVITGAIAVHKRLYKALQGAKANTRAIINAWKIINGKWKKLTESLKAQPATDHDLTRRWRAYSGFLASTVSAWIVDGDEHVIEGKLSKSSKMFLLEILDLLTNMQSSYLRETAREILSRDTNHAAYHFIFTTLEERLTKLFKNQADFSEKDYLLLEQSVLFLRTIIEYMNDGEVYLAVDIASLTLSIVKKLDGLGMSERVLKLRIQYANLVASISRFKDYMNLKHDLQVRNEIALLFCSWLDRGISYKYTNEELDSTRSGGSAGSSGSVRSDRRIHDRERLQKDCIVAVVESLAVVALRLVIDVPLGTHEKDMQEVKSNRFSIIFMQLVRTLEKCCAEETHSRGSLVLGDRLETIKNKTIESLSKLLDSNVDVGLKFAFPLAIHQDSFIRVSFLKILDNILSHSSGSDDNHENEGYQQLSDFLASNIPVTVSLCDVCPAIEVDEFSTALLAVYEGHNNSLSLVKTVITREVERADTPMEILRRNCVATKILSIYAHTKGLPYLHAALGSFINDIIDNPETYVFETNPDKIPEGQTVEENISRFKLTLRKLLKALEESLNHIPFVFREICHTIAITADARYIGKNASVNALSAFFFLRFVCPSLVTPESDILSNGSTCPKDVKRTLLILAKMVQNLAYGTGSFVKLSIFKNSNITFRSETATVVRILKRLTNTDDAISYGGEIAADDTASISAASSSGLSTKTVDRSHLETIHKFLYNHWEDVNHKLQTEMRMKRRGITASNNRHVYPRQPTPVIDPKSSATSSALVAAVYEGADFRINQELTLLVRNLGKPRSSDSKPENQMGIANIQGFAPRLREFLERNSHRDMDLVIEKKIIHEGLSKEGMPLLILTAQNYLRDSLDTELVVCRFFQVASKMMNQKFALLYDATCASPDNLLPTSANSIVSMMVPDILAQNCVAVYLLNVPGELIPALRSSFRPFQTGAYLNPMTTKYHFITSKDVHTKFNLGTLNLDARSERAALDARVEFKSIYQIDQQKQTSTQVSLRIGNEYIQVISDEPFVFGKGINGFYNSAYHLSDVNHVELSSSSEEYVVIVIRGGEHKVVLRAGSKVRAHEIVRSIVSAKARLPKTALELANSKQTQLYQTLESSLGSLLNVSFSSLCSNNAASKSAAYNLLATIQNRFKLGLGGVALVRGRGIRLPANIFSRVQKYSRSIAETRPELTHDVIEGMFSSFQGMTPSCRQGALMYIVPWIKNLNEQIFQNEPDQYKRGTTARIIRQLLEICVTDEQDYMYMLQSIWPLIIKEPNLLPILIEEVLSLVLERDLITSNKADDIIAILTAHQSLEVCETIINQIIDFAMQAACVKDNSLINHPQWQEIVILVSILSAMLFENPEAAVKHCANLCLIVLMFLYTGPYSFRVSLYNLLINMMHSFLYSDEITPESSSHIMTLWKDMTTNKGNMIFGISEELKNVAYDYPVTSIMFQIEACSTVLVDLCRCLSSGEELEQIHSRFTGKCLTLCTQRYSVFQGRGVVTLGCISRLDVADSTVTTILEILVDVLDTADNKIRTELIACASFCISRLAVGLRVDSKYHGYLFWVAIAFLNTQNTKIFGYGLQLLQTVLRSLDDFGIFKQTSLINYLMNARDEFKEQWGKIEKMLDITFSRQYFELNLSFALLPGMIKAVTRAATLATFDTLLIISARNYIYREREGSVFSTNIVVHNDPNSDALSVLSDTGKSVVAQHALQYEFAGSHPNLHGPSLLNSASSIVSGNSSLFGGAASSGGSSASGHFNLKHSRSSNGQGLNNAFSSPLAPFNTGNAPSSYEFEGDEQLSASSFTTSKEFPPHMVYLFFLYLGSRSHSDLRDYLWIAGYPDGQMIDKEIPLPIQRFLGNNHHRAAVSLYLGAIMYNESDDEEIICNRYLEVLKYVGTVSVHNYFRGYFVIRPKIKRIVDSSASIESVKLALQCAKTALMNYNELSRAHFYLTELDELLVKAGFGPSKITGGGIQHSILAHFISSKAFSEKTFFQEHNVPVASVGSPASGIVAVGATPNSGLANYGYFSNMARSTTSSTATPTSFGSNHGSTVSGAHGQNYAASGWNTHAGSNTVANSAKVAAKWADQQLSLFLERLIEISKSQHARQAQITQQQQQQQQSQLNTLSEGVAGLAVTSNDAVSPSSANPMLAQLLQHQQGPLTSVISATSESTAAPSTERISAAVPSSNSNASVSTTSGAAVGDMAGFSFEDKAVSSQSQGHNVPILAYLQAGTSDPKPVSPTVDGQETPISPHAQQVEAQPTPQQGQARYPGQPIVSPTQSEGDAVYRDAEEGAQ